MVEELHLDLTPGEEIARLPGGVRYEEAGNPVLATAACSSDPTGPRAGYAFQFLDLGVVVMAQGSPTTFGPDALFEGPIIADNAGCLRWDDEAGPTVVWPFGFTGEVTTDGVAILNEDGEEVGRVGEEFSLGGGIVPELLGSSQEDRGLAEEICPGNYLIVAPPRTE